MTTATALRAAPPPFRQSLPPHLPEPVRAVLEPSLARLSGNDRLARLYAAVPGSATAAQFAGEVLNLLQIGCVVEPADLARVPRQGGLIIAANLPNGAADGLALLRVLGEVRPDLRLVAPRDLLRFPALQNTVLPLATRQDAAAFGANMIACRQAVAWVRQGGALVVFPGADAVPLSLRHPQVGQDWEAHIGRLVQLTGAPVLPVHCTCRGGGLARLTRRLHGGWGPLLLPRRLLRQRGRTIGLRFGTPLPAAALARFEQPGRVARYLRFRTQILASRHDWEHQAPATTLAQAEPLAPAEDPALLAREIAALPPDQRLLVSGDKEVYYASASQIPTLLRELGRLRELTFRAAGEGTGRSRDLDGYDDYYLQLFVWDPQAREIIGAYRLGRVDEILATRGLAGLYTAELFRCRPELFTRLGKGLELGRSFVVPHHQRSYSALLLLWKGIGHYLTSHPDYRVLFGAVSISNDYRGLSRLLMARYLGQSAGDQLASLVKPRRKLRGRATGAADPTPFLPFIEDVEEISTWVADIEPDGKGVPILIKHYLRLGGRILALSVDRAFSNTLDGLIVVACDQIDPKAMSRYMPRDGAAAYFARGSHPAQP